MDRARLCALDAEIIEGAERASMSACEGASLLESWSKAGPLAARSREGIAKLSRQASLRTLDRSASETPRSRGRIGGAVFATAGMPDSAVRGAAGADWLANSASVDDVPHQAAAKSGERFAMRARQAPRARALYAKQTGRVT